jgi:D-alanine-D-alanine ligase
MAATLDKAVAKRIVRDQGIATAPFAVLRSPSEVDAVDLPFPLFVKPIAEGTGKGCEKASRVTSADELSAAATQIIAKFDQPALAETFLPGREFTVGILGTGERAHVIGVAEVIVRADAADPVYSYENKEMCETMVVYELATDAEAMAAAHTALAAYHALECRDAARLDFRSDAEGVPHFLEANPIAGLHPSHSDLPIIADLAGLGYDALISGILQSAVERQAPPKSHKSATGKIREVV